ncbi:MAG: 1-acyl-sn-glycerol-3-phosphate acyltransferase [Ramlibacter sp.]|jgi:1-acyl-sn-glycerol-3-phosphate acyltransferase|nr:1-acyl-sn-glycerol-3-phosphate acyltransferase [Ramlibacter sp.]
MRKTQPIVGPARKALRLLLLGTHLLRGWFELRVLFGRVPVAEQRWRVKDWCDRMLHIAGVTLEVQGIRALGHPVLLVANHVSWLDVVVLQALHPCRFVAKKEVRDWPMIGAMATRCETLYVDRDTRRFTLQAAAAIAAALRQGDSVVLFPEGTTSDGSRLLPFRASLLQGAIDARVRVVPVALRFADRGTASASRAAAYVGDDSLLGAMWRGLGRNLTVRVTFGDAVEPGATRRRELAADLHSRVAGLQATHVR